jgi:hypothetical protein
MTAKWTVLCCLTIAALAGCTDKPSLFPNSDPTLRKTKAEFAADAKKRVPYPGAATEEANGVASVDVVYDKIQLTNLSSEEWKNLEMWVNQAYVVRVPKVEAKGTGIGIRTLDFQMIYNAKGEHLPTNNDKYPIKSVEIRRNGVMYKVPVKYAL